MPIDDRTPNFNLPKPNVLNIQTDDVARLRSALDGVDTALQSQATSIAAKADLVSGKVPAGQLPSYVDDVVDAANFAALPVTGESGKIYITLDTSPVKQWRWSGSAYAEMQSSYTLPSATPSVLGGVKVGAGLTVTPDGEISTVGGGSGSGIPVFDELSITPASNGQTVFTPAGGYTAGQIEIFKNGVLQYGNGDDYTATNGTTFTLTVGANTTDTLLLRRWIYLPSSLAVNKTGDTMTGALNWAPAVSVASAGTTNIGLAASNRVIITGTTTITSLGTIAAGVARTVTFAAALTLTHNATSLILPGAANITTAAGDTAEFESLGSGNWRCVWYQRADGSLVLSASAARAAFGAASLAANTFTGAQVFSDQVVSRGMLKDTGVVYFNSGTTNALDYTNGSHQRWAPSTGAQTLSIANWPPTGNLGELMIEGVNLGAATITWPTVNWIKTDGTMTTTFSSNGVTLQASGVDFVMLWTRDGGTTIYGKVVR